MSYQSSFSGPWLNVLHTPGDAFIVLRRGQINPTLSHSGSSDNWLRKTNSLISSPSARLSSISFLLTLFTHGPTLFPGTKWQMYY